MNLPAVCFAIPAMDELGTLEKTLECIARQDYRGKISVWVCVNGPYSDYETAYHDSFWQATEHKTNQQATDHKTDQQAIDHKTDQQAFDLETAADATSFDNITPEIRHAKMRILHNELLWNHLIQNPWNLDLHLIDRYSPDKAWREKQAGVALQTCCHTLPMTAYLSAWMRTHYSIPILCRRSSTACNGTPMPPPSIRLITIR